MEMEFQCSPYQMVTDKNLLPQATVRNSSYSLQHLEGLPKLRKLF